MTEGGCKTLLFHYRTKTSGNRKYELPPNADIVMTVNTVMTNTVTKKGYTSDHTHSHSILKLFELSSCVALCEQFDGESLRTGFRLGVLGFTFLFMIWDWCTFGTASPNISSDELYTEIFWSFLAQGKLGSHPMIPGSSLPQKSHQGTVYWTLCYLFVFKFYGL